MDQHIEGRDLLTQCVNICVAARIGKIQLMGQGLRSSVSDERCD
jgi:hypothetical protein